MGFEIPHLLPGNIKTQIVPFNNREDLVPDIDVALTDEESTEIEQAAVEEQQANATGEDENQKLDDIIQEKTKKKLSEKKNEKIQLFSYRNPNTQNFPTEGDNAITRSLQLGFLPNSFKHAFKKDISRKILFDDLHLTAGCTAVSDKHLTIDTILNNIPAVQIREFLPDLKLDQMITGINLVLKEIQQFTKDKSLSDIGNKLADSFKGVISELANADFEQYKHFFKYIAMYLINKKSKDGSFTKSLVDDLFTSEYTEKFKNSYKSDLDCDLNTMLLKIPYTIWYGLQSTTTTNIYEVPFINENKSLYSSNGAAGWQGSNTGFTASLVNAAKSIMGTILPSIGISFTPWWDSTSGQSTFDDDAVVNFDLFNDTAEHAAINFTFINTIIPNNKWMQYGLIQHSPCLYDVRIEGIKRMYACTGEFKVTYSGKLRIPPSDFITDKLKKNFTVDADMYDQANDKNIKIPDVYHVQLVFKSLMPSNMNTYLFNFFGNKVITSVRDEGALKKLLDGVKNVKTSIEDMWTNAKNDAGK